jgi:hypothetical protein
LNGAPIKKSSKPLSLISPKLNKPSDEKSDAASPVIKTLADVNFSDVCEKHGEWPSIKTVKIANINFINCLGGMMYFIIVHHVQRR